VVGVGVREQQVKLSLMQLLFDRGLLGGHLSIESTPQAGTRITVTLPAAAAVAG